MAREEWGASKASGIFRLLVQDARQHNQARLREGIMTGTLSRRAFAKFLGSLAGAAALPRPATAVPLPAPQNPGDSAEGMILINSNENPYGPSQRARDAMWQSQHVAGRYPDDADTRIAAAIAQHHHVGTENIVLGCGSTEILRLADMAFLSPGKNVVACDPTFEAVLRYAKATKAEGVLVPQTADYRHDLPAMATACNANTGLVYVCNPNNPTGTIVSRDEMTAFLPRVPSTAMIVIDEAYHHFVEDPGYATSQGFMRRYPNIILVRTFSKIYGMAGLRLGYSISTPEAAAAMRAHQFSSNVNAAVAEAALASLEDPHHVAQSRRVFNSTRAWLCTELEKDGRRYIPSHTNFVMIYMGMDVTPAIEAFAHRNIAVGRKFSRMEDWLRVSIGTRAEMEAFLTVLRDIAPARRTQAA
jgi:histidinol-phosphate aminotransferase